ncbi:MAG: hypothetical protein NTZ78_12995 [Candidatus Aureabacteria bacterium]|nr:hypothetical protein [Candidatus Auribacterota bacterium]
MPEKPTDQLRQLLERHPCWMLTELAKALGYAQISVRRFLKQIGYFRSYSDNGKWYTSRSQPVFDRDGLWRYKAIGFSRHGSLIATIRSLLDKSSTGLSAGELGGKLHHPCDGVLSSMYQGGRLDRIRVGRAFRYLSPQSWINRRQRVALEARQPTAAAAPLSAQVAVWVLVECIKQPQLRADQIAAHIQARRQLTVSTESINSFFEQHGLKKVRI